MINAFGPKIVVLVTPALSLIVTDLVIAALAELNKVLVLNAVGIVVIGEGLVVCATTLKCTITKSFLPKKFAKGPFGKFSLPATKFANVEL